MNHLAKLREEEMGRDRPCPSTNFAADTAASTNR